ncbi:MAG: winged helix-turn-helix transcriptional regulator, partial [Oscillospiraceae bacterium]|nr:winged helix-turn-helix transcriptional regulator [Oscillospiraceae bacterium]
MATFNPVSSNKLYIQIYNQIHDAIINGVYKVGDKLPSEKEFCAMFNVSRVPVREALCALELNGLVDSIQGVGVYVKERPAKIDLAW